MKHIARKRFGQHFLTDGAIIDAIIDAIAPQPGEALIEIGPGLGAMTHPLVARCEQLTVIELDRDLAQRLRARPGIEVIEADVLQVDFDALALARGQRLRVVGNLPYNISSPILFHLLGSAARVVDQHFMLQKEVVERMAAGPGTKDYGRLSVMLQWRYDIESVLDVPPESFDPPPRVDWPSCACCRCPTRPASSRRCSANWYASRSRSAASCCATRSDAGWTSAALPASSTCSGAPKRCRWPTTSRSPRP